MKETETDILLLSEINIPWNNITTHIFGKYFKKQNISSYKVISTSSTETCKSFYFPGGCAILMQGPVIGRIAGTGEDTRVLERWCYVKLNGTGGKITWIIAAYMVQNNPYVGTETVYKQHLWLLAQQGIPDPKPHIIWDNDFVSFLKEIPDRDKIMIGIDANAPI
eukprot:4370415-Ditylum_brightwellii.AAC.1